MLGIKYIKFPPTTYVLHYSGGRLKREGAGLSFFYYAPTSILVAIPQASNDFPFVFQEITLDFQTVTVQGVLTYRIADPKRLAGLLDYSILPHGEYKSDDPELLNMRLVQGAQIFTREHLQRMKLQEVLVSVDSIVDKILAGLRESESVTMHGLEILGLSLQSIRPTPEMARALEAEAREDLQRRADGAIYDRRNAAVEQERRIKESELNTELAVEEKRRQIREAQMAADIAVEEQRATLVTQRIENDRQEADSRSYALESVLKPIKSVDWKTLMAMGNCHDSQTMIAVAFREIAENAQKIGELNISPDLLTTLLGQKGT